MQLYSSASSADNAGLPAPVARRSFGRSIGSTTVTRDEATRPEPLETHVEETFAAALALHPQGRQA